MSFISKFTKKCDSQTTPSRSRNSQGQETLLPPSIDMQTYNYDNDCSNHQKLGAIFASTYARMVP